MGKHPQFDLGVVGTHQHHIAAAGGKDLAQLSSEFLTDGDVLQVGLRAADAPRCRNGLLEMRMDAAVRTDQGQHAFHIGAVELGQRAEFQHFFDDGIVRRQLFQDLGVRGIALFRLFTGR